MHNNNSFLFVKNLTDAWQFRQSGKPGWHPATVPGCVQLDLLDNKLIDDPFYRDNETKVQWIENEDWEYRLIFDVSSEFLAKKHLRLVFEGLDTYATVTLNDRTIIKADNMFRPWHADVKSIVNEKQNELIVHFRSPIQEVLPKLNKLDRKLPAASDQKIGTSPYTRKAPYHFGWDWGPRLVTSGIWQPVKLEAWNDFKIENQQFIIRTLNDKKVILEVINVITSDIKTPVNLKIYSDKTGILFEEKLNLKIGSNKIKKEIEIKNPEFWWPNGYGNQPLYTFKTEFSTEKDIIKFSKRIGLRTIKIERAEDQWGESFTVVVNGEPIFVKGANWIPSDSFTPRISEDKYRYLISSAVQANMNMLRVWGGGIYESEIFYDICDELGILIWQDFMFSCALYPGADEFLNSVFEEATYQVRRLRHHPSIALWCGNNEIEMGWHSWGWQQKLPPSCWEDYLKLFHGVLPQVCETEDPTRLYWASSPASDVDAIYNPNDPARGDTHYWGVWHGQEPFEFYHNHLPRFISEFGFQSFPEPQSIAKFTTDEDRDILTPVMLLHQKNPQGNMRIKNYMENHYQIPQNFDHFLWLSQLLQAEGIKIGVEHFRRIRPRCMGCLYWQINDCWPVASWASIDYYGRWKALHHFARRFYAPILVSPHLENENIKFHIISDKGQAVHARLKIIALDFKGTVYSKSEKHLIIQPNESAVHDSIAKKDLSDQMNMNESFIYCRLEDENGKIISENSFFFELPKNLKLNQPDIKQKIEKTANGFAVSLSSKILTRSVILTVDGVEGHFEDNFFDLYPGQTREIRFNTNSAISDTDFKKSFSWITLFELMEMKD